MLSSLRMFMTVLVLTILYSYRILILLYHFLNRALHLVLSLIALVSLHCINDHQASIIRQQFKLDSS